MTTLTLAANAEDADHAYQHAPFYAVVCPDRWVVYGATTLCDIESKARAIVTAGDCGHNHLVVALSPQPKTEDLFAITSAAHSPSAFTWDDEGIPMRAKCMAAIRRTAVAAYDPCADVFIDLDEAIPGRRYDRDADLTALGALLREAQVIYERLAA